MNRTVVSLLFLQIVTIPLLSCTHADVRAPEGTRVSELERELRQKKNELQDLKERNLVLERRLKLVKPSVETASTSRNDSVPALAPVPVPFEPSASGERPRSMESEPRIQSEIKKSTVADANVPRIELTASQRGDEVPVGLSDDGKLYTKILETYRTRKIAELEKSVSMMIKTFPDSVFADNALFLAGQLAFEQGDLARAATYMDRVVDDYPNGNKAVSALYAKAMIEKRLSRAGESRRILESLLRAYPGSPEAMRASMEIKLMSLKPTVRKGI